MDNFSSFIIEKTSFLGGSATVTPPQEVTKGMSRQGL
jgi:hypothetical protein